MPGNNMKSLQKFIVLTLKIDKELNQKVNVKYVLLKKLIIDECSNLTNKNFIYQKYDIFL